LLKERVVVLSDQKTQDLVRRIVEASHPLRVLLFGSTARGDAGRYSDIDVLVVVEDGSHRRHTAQRIYRNLVGFGIPVDVVVATPTDLERYADSPGLVYREAIREGKELYAA
jgi:uncharacterized protein